MAAAGGQGWAAGSAGRLIKPGAAEVLVGHGPRSVRFFLIITRRRKIKRNTKRTPKILK